MAIPQNISKEHLLKAILKIDKEGIPNDGDSQYYDVVYQGKKYPPKVIISYANFFANGYELERKSFAGGINTPCFNLLQENNFVIEEKTKRNINEPNIWFVTQGETFTKDRGMKFLWAPKHGKDNKSRFYWENVLKVRKGDFVFNYSEGLKGISIAKTDGYLAKNNDTNSQWGEEGFKVDIDVNLLDPHISSTQLASHKKVLASYLSSIVNKPFASNESVNKGYLFEFTKEAGKYLRKIYGKKFGNELIDLFFDNVLIDEMNKMNKSTNSLEILNFLSATTIAGLFTSKSLVVRFIASLLTKPFVILTGLSGSGKTKLAQAFVQWICNEKSSNLTSKRFKNGEELNSQRVTYKVSQSDLNSVTLTQIDSNTKVTLPYELIYEWIDVIKKNDFDISTPTRNIRDIVGQFTKYSTQLNSFESHLKVAAFELIARKNQNSESSSQYLIIPVGADWTNREPLLGYPNALNPEEYVRPDSGVLDLIIQANNQPELPHFLILDEMNLSHVERYFADFLSVMESKEEIPLYAEGTVENGVPAKLKLPYNLFIIGTVNIDETTNMFSPKVLDRANTIEFRVTQDEMKNFLGNIKDINMDALTGKGTGMAKSFLDMSASKSFATADIDAINEALVKFFSELKKTGAEFGYRSASEILRLIHQLTVLDKTLSTNQKIDIAIMQKLLPKLHGSRRKLCPVLETLGLFCISGDAKIIKDIFENAEFDFNGTNVLYPLSLEKIARMYKSAIDNGFSSFAEA